MNKQKALQKIEKLIQEGNDVLTTKFHKESQITQASGVSVCYIPTTGDYVDPGKFNSWREKINNFLHSHALFKASLKSFEKKFTFNTNYEYSKWYMDVLKALKENIEDDIIKLSSDLTESAISNNESCIFIGHGHSKLWNEVVRFLNDDIGFSNNIYFEKKSQVGRFIGDALRDFRKEATFAIIVMTAEDETKEEKIRARQNVIHEIGFFQGKLGFEKVAILKQKNVESFTNIDGLQYIEFSDNEIHETFYALQKMLKREGIIS